MDEVKSSMEDKKESRSMKPIMYDGIMMPPLPGIFPDPEKRFQEKSEMECRDSDVFLCSFPKAGTHWTHEILSMLISQSTEYNTFGTYENGLEFTADLDKFKEQSSPRFFLTHLPFKYLPKQLQNGTGKIVFVQRNPKDLYVSMYNFLKGKGMIDDAIKWSEYIEMVISGKMDVMGGWFQYSLEWEKQFDKEKILTVHYEDMKKDPVANILKMAEFLEVSCSTNFAEEIADKTSFEKLKNNKIDSTSRFDKDGKSRLFRKGQVGDWKNWFTVAQNERFDALYAEKMKDSKQQFTFEL